MSHEGNIPYEISTILVHIWLFLRMRVLYDWGGGY
jgi:hypothetical protein